MVHAVWPIGGDLHFENAIFGDGFHGHAGESEVVGKLAVVNLGVDELAQPMRRNLHLCKLFQKTNISLEQQLNVVNSILQHRNAVNAHAKGKAADLLRIVAVVFNKFEDVRVHHAATQQLDPATLLASTAAFSATKRTTDLHISAGFSKREERGIKPRLHTGAK